MRVSTGKQQTDTQEYDLLKRYPEGIAHKETASGVKARPVLEALVRDVTPGSTIVVSALDRLGRKTSDILRLIETLQKKSVNVISLREQMDYSNPTGRLVMQIMASVGELERSLIAQRTKAALQAKKAAGVRLGTPPKHGEATKAAVRAARASGQSYREITKALGVSACYIRSVTAALLPAQ
jgi:DNA invertase Pin-like site-specific DNA recombinase